MEIQQLKGFQAVAKDKNFTKAAKKTGRTQPTISLQVKALEQELGVKLFERLGPRNVKLTEEGKLLQKLSAPLLQEFIDLPVRFKEELGSFSSSQVKIVTHSSVMVYLLPEVVKSFKKLYPDTPLCILNRSQSEILSMVEDGDADFGITSLQKKIKPSLNYDVLSKYRRILIATKDHPLSKNKTISLEDIAEHPLILPTQDSNTRKSIDKRFSEKDLDYNLTMEVVGRTAIKTYVEMNLGISILNEYYVTAQDKKKLLIHDMSDFFGKAETGIITRKKRNISVPAKKFLSLIKEHI